MACVAVDPATYPEPYAAAWKVISAQAQAQGMALPSIYPGSVYAACETCHVQIAVGPRQQETIADALNEHVPVCLLCLVCAIVAVRQETRVVSLDNDYVRRTD